MKYLNKRFIAGAAILAVGLTVASATTAVGEPASSVQQSANPQSTVRHLNHVFIIMEENHAADGTIGDAKSMPFLNSLADTYNVATTYYGVTHTSEPNYIAATSGSNWGVNNDNGWEAGSTENGVALPANQYDHTNIVDQLEANHIPWAAYMDSMPSAGYLPDKSPDGLYVSKHNPFILYQDVRLDPARTANIKPYTDMASDLNGKNVPKYVWISPNLCNDMHGGIYSTIPGHPETPCPYSDAIGDPLDQALKAKADSFLKTAVQTIMSSKAWTGNSVIFVTADENDFDAANASIGQYASAAGCCDSPLLPAGDPEISPNWPGGVYGGGLVPMIVISRNGPTHVSDPTPYNHYSMLSTIEQGFGLSTLGFASDAAQVQPMWPLISGKH
ncbi:alkaline phosphatase family protein [Rathayibacter soli]|uniref:alkaline phosphatase family protein n=1 Tax=Rathayibacter soli TaxID=3144168 RepID=UPI0027E56A57|nr:alkaline phosphatase family protein [Glaciibacter superstes]